MTTDQLVKKHGGNIRAAAKSLGLRYEAFWRWHRREVYAPENSATRREMRAKGVELPRRPKGTR